MRAPVAAAESSLGFDALRRLLDVLEGEDVVVSLACRDSRASDRPAMLLGGSSGQLHMVGGDEVPTAHDVPDGAVEAGERAYLLEVGGNTCIAVSSADYVGGSYRGNTLRVQTGPLMMTLEVMPHA
jgi:hypothetical protein